MKFHKLHPTPEGFKHLPARSGISFPWGGEVIIVSLQSLLCCAVRGVFSQGSAEVTEKTTGSVKEALIALSLSLCMNEHDVGCLLM